MAEKVLMKGNEALAEAAIQAGCHHFFGYPITPQTELAAYMAKRMPKIGGTYLQAESEIAAVNMVLGAAAAGVRAMTSSSSPGISLKGEGISYMAGSDLPAVIINVQRGGPGLGGIQPSQADYWQATKALGHGDFQILVFAPSTVQEMVNLVSDAFDKADQYRMPAMILADGMLGQMMEPVELPEKKAQAAIEKPWAACGHGGKRRHNIVNSLYLTPNALEDLVRERYARYEVIKAKRAARGGIPHRGRRPDRRRLRRVEPRRAQRRQQGARGRPQGRLVRPITLWPFPTDAIQRAAKQAKQLLVVEMSMGQMVDDVRLAANCSVPVHFYGRTGGIIPTPKEVLGEIKKLLK